MTNTHLASVILDTVRQSMRLSIGEVRYFDFQHGRELWAVSARSADGEETWISKAEDYYEAACGLAAMVGFEVDDG